MIKLGEVILAGIEIRFIYLKPFVLRHTLQVKDADVDSKSFAFFGGSELFKLDEKWDNSAAWAYLKNSRSYLEELAEKHGVDLYDLCLGKEPNSRVFYYFSQKA